MQLQGIWAFMPVLALALVACGGGSSAEPAALKASPASERQNVEPSPTPSVAGPASPTTAPADPKAEVEAAVRAYFDAANVALSTGDTKRLRELSTPDCTCLGAAAHIEAIYKTGDRTVGASWQASRVRVAFGVAQGRSDVTVDSTFGAYRTINGLGVTTESIPDQRLVQNFVLRRDQGAWRVADIDSL